jgi:hypothetical protein
LAQVYFDLYPRKITLGELNAAFPGLVGALVAHEGVGFVVAYADDGTPLALGKQGTRDLHSGEITGDDPLAPYGDVALRARQVRRIADFPHSGDLIVNSTIYPDGTVAAMEELIGNHGGLGGEQTDAFLFHPSDMTVPDTANSADLFAILDARRGLPVAEKEPPPDQQVRSWTPGTLWQGLRQVRTWLVYTLRALSLSRSAYWEVAADPYMTGPALLIAVLGSLVLALTNSHSPLEVVFELIVRLLGWLLGVLVVFGAARFLGGTGSFTATLRGMGFAQGVYLLELLAFVPVLSSLIRLVTTILVFVATWMAGLEAHELHGWRGLLLPVARLLLVVLSVAVFAYLIVGTEFTFESLLREAGMLAPGP